MEERRDGYAASTDEPQWRFESDDGTEQPFDDFVKLSFDEGLGESSTRNASRSDSDSDDSRPPPPPHKSFVAGSVEEADDLLEQSSLQAPVDGPLTDSREQTASTRPLTPVVASREDCAPSGAPHGLGIDAGAREVLDASRDNSPRNHNECGVARSISPVPGLMHIDQDATVPPVCSEHVQNSPEHACDRAEFFKFDIMQDSDPKIAAQASAAVANAAGSESSRFDGSWLRDPDRQLIAEIRGRELTWEGSFNTQTVEVSGNRIFIRGLPDSDVCEGRLQDSRIHWSDGDKWIRGQASPRIDTSDELEGTPPSRDGFGGVPAEVVEAQGVAIRGPPGEVESPAEAGQPPEATAASELRRSAYGEERKQPRRGWPKKSRRYDILRAYSTVAARCPGTCALLWLIVLLSVIAIGLLTMPPELDTDFGAFMDTDVPASVDRSAFLAALGERSDARRLQAAGLFTVFDLYVGYELKATARHKSMLHYDNLVKVAGIEQHLRSKPLWSKLCDLTPHEDRSLCSPGVSVVGYAMPSVELNNASAVPAKAHFDGRGKFRIPIEAAMTWIEDSDLLQLLLPKGFDLANSNSEPATSLRSAFRFRFFCCSAADSMQVQRASLAKFRGLWKEFLAEVVETFEGLSGEYVNADGEAEELPFTVNFDGPDVEGVQVMAAISRDARLAIGSSVFVFLYVALHTRSVFLSVTGLIIIFLAVPLAYVVYATISGSTQLSIACLLSLFLVVGLGSDILFVYVDFWRDSKCRRHTELNRVIWTYLNAGKASFATAFTTALSFFANLVSVLKALREFGVFMGLCILLVWLVVSLVFLPLCVVDERCHRSCFARRLPKMGFMRGRSLDETRRRLLEVWAEKVLQRAKLAVGVCFLILVGNIAGTILYARVDNGVPSIFPESHNQNRVKEVFGGFAVAGTADNFGSLDTAPEPAAVVRGPGIFGEDSASEASSAATLHWCEAHPLLSTLAEGQCRCYRQDPTRRPRGCAAGATATAVRQLVVGVDAGGEEVLREQLVQRLEAMSLRLPAGLTALGRGRMLLQDWDSGAAQLRPRYTLEAGSPSSPGGAGDCSWAEACFCGSFTCGLPPSWRSSGTFNATGTQRLGPSRRLDAWRVPAKQRTRVDVIFGIKTVAGSPTLGKMDASKSWEFISGFDIKHPWVQRDIYFFCTSLPSELRVTSSACWLQNLREHVRERGIRFPVIPINYDRVIGTYLEWGTIGNPPKLVQHYLWRRDGVVKATFVSMDVDLHRFASADEALRFKQLWDGHVAEYNERASKSGRGAWQTSSVWVRAEAQQSLVSSTALTLLVAVLTAFLGMLCFTRDCRLALFVVLSAVFVISGLAVVMTCILSWAIGPLEVIALIVFVGYAVTYSLHIAHKYSSIEAVCDIQAFPEGSPTSPASPFGPRSIFDSRGISLSAGSSSSTTIRYSRASYAMKAIGGAMLGSAVTSAGCSVFLVFCTMTIFQKFGAVVLLVTLMSILTALVPLPALLFLLGPRDPGQSCMQLAARLRERVRA